MRHFFLQWPQSDYKMREMLSNQFFEFFYITVYKKQNAIVSKLRFNFYFQFKNDMELLLLIFIQYH
jgi:hypothetical protein